MKISYFIVNLNMNGFKLKEEKNHSYSIIYKDVTLDSSKDLFTLVNEYSVLLGKEV